MPHGDWRTAIEDIGMPVGRPQTVVVDLTGRVPAPRAEVRIETTMRVYWDRVAGGHVGRQRRHSGRRASRRRPPICAGAASRPRSRPMAREPYGYDYDRVSPTPPGS